MSFIKYNEKESLNPVGFNNLGQTCYYNALMQALLSCTSFVQIIKQINDNAEIENSNDFLKILKHIIKKIETANSQNDIAEINNLGGISWKYMIRELIKKTKTKFEFGQQCSVEAYTFLLQSLNFASLQNLFIHRRRNKLYCPNCETYFSDLNEINNIFEIKSNTFNNSFTQTNLNDFLLKQTDNIDENCICSNCKVKGSKSKHSNLVMIPEILFVMRDKYHTDSYDKSINFPEELVFTGKSKDNMIYKAVAQIEHSGNVNGGHYWAICKRKNKWYNINDAYVTSAEFKPSVNTYIVLYHIV